MKSSFKSSIAAMLGLIVIWQLIVSFTGVPRFILPSPFLVGLSFVENFELIAELALVTLSDIMLGLGKMDNPDDPDDSTRWITVMKNKISGWHGTVMCNLDVKRSRYVA